MKMEECKKFDKCSAPICPLDPDYKIRVHLPDDRVCLYLREYAKTDGRANIRVALPQEHYELIQVVTEDILSRGTPDKFGQLKKRIIKSAETPSTIHRIKQ